MSELDSQVAVDFLLHWSPEGPWVVTAVDPERKKDPITRTFLKQQVKELLAFLVLWNGERNLYFSVNIPRVTINSKLKKEHIGWASALHVDVDPNDKPEGIEPEDWLAQEQERILSALAGYSPPPSVIMFSGGGYQGFWLLDTPLEIEEVTKETPAPWADFEAYNRKIEKDLGGDHCFNIDRIMRLPGTLNIPDAKKKKKGRVPVLASLLFAEWSKVYELKQFEQWFEPKKVSKNSSSAALQDGSTRIKFDAPEWVTRVLQNGPDPDINSPQHFKGDRSRALWAVCCALVRANWSEGDIAEAILDKENKLSGHVYDQDNPTKYAARQAAKAAEHAGSDFIYGKSGTPIPNQQNVVTALNKLSVSLSYDEFARRHLIEGPNSKPARVIEDRECNEVYLMIAREFHFRPSIEMFKMMIEDEAYKKSFHPVKQYLEGLHWDGTKRIDTWLIDYADAADNIFVRAVSRIILIAAVKRIRQPGCKFDEIVVLESPQGFNKSSALAILATRHEWFTDSLPLNANDKEIIEAISGKWIVESPELKGMRRADVEHHKAMLSRQVDRARMSYGRFTSEVPRQCVFFGTTNADSYLRDTTGNRRFWPIKVGDMKAEAIAKVVPQLWAEAAMAEAKGESIRLARELYPMATLEQERRTVEDPWEMLIEGSLNGFSTGKILAADVWKIVNVPVHMRTQEHNARIGEAMKKLGWERKKLRFGGDNPSWCYAAGDVEERSLRVFIERSESGELQVSRQGTGESDEPPKRETLIPDIPF